MIKVGIISTEPDAIAFWTQFDGKAPTPEHLIAVLSAAAKERMAKVLFPVAAVIVFKATIKRKKFAKPFIMLFLKRAFGLFILRIRRILSVLLFL